MLWSLWAIPFAICLSREHRWTKMRPFYLQRNPAAVSRMLLQQKSVPQLPCLLLARQGNAGRRMNQNRCSFYLQVDVSVCKQREADVPMVYRRNSHYCQAADCVFNRSMPGQPARATATNCVWCDPDAMARALEGGSTLKNVRLSLSMFEQKDTAVYERAMALLPVGFTRSAESYMLCQNAQCCFSTVTVGGRAYTESPVCLLCDPKTLLVYGTEEHVRKRVNTILNRL